METLNLILKHPDFADWEDMYRNLWCHPESARYMLWQVTTSEEEAKERMRRSIAWQEAHPTCWFVYEKTTNRAIGFAGMTEISEGVWEDTGIALGPDYTGRGYGRQILQLLTEYARQELGARRFVCSCRSENAPSRRMILSRGFRYTHSSQAADPRTQESYTLEFYEKDL